MSFYFVDKTWPELKKAIAKNSLILLPVGTIEEHGKHLPVSTDVTIAEEVTYRIADSLKQQIPLLVMPCIWTGYSSKEMSRWPGTIRVNPHTLINLVVDIMGSLIEMGFKKIVLISTHGHHTGILNVAVREIGDKYGVHVALTFPDVMAITTMSKIRKSKIGGAIHGGEYETSLMLYFKKPVNMKKATSQDIMRYHSEFYPGDNFVKGKKVFWSTWGIQQSKTGIYGDPTVAAVRTGELLMKSIIKEYKKFLREFYYHKVNRSNG